MRISLPKAKKLEAKERLEVVLQVVEKNKPVSRVCKRVGISRDFFYKLKKQYFEAGESRKEKLKALEPRRKWIRRGRQLSGNQIKQIIKVVLKNPEYGIPKILEQIQANNRKKIVSHGGIQTFLLKLDLNTKEKRKAFTKWAQSLPKGQVLDLVLMAVRRYKSRETLTPAERLKAVRLVDDGTQIAQVCRCFQIGRKNFYKWYQRYHQSVPGREYQAVTNKKPVVKRYWRQATNKQIEAVLKIVVKHPEYSTHRVSAALPKIAGRPTLGNHGVQNAFKRLNLNTYEKRLAYAQTHVPTITPVARGLDRLRPIFGKIPVISAIPPPTREKFTSAFPPFVFSLFFSIVFSTIFIYWLGIISQAPTPRVKLGLFCASVSFLIGGFFFAYSMKYYFTLALVLSFSRQPSEEGGGYTIGLNGKLNGNHKNGNGGNWLLKIFGLGNGNGNGLSTSFDKTQDKDSGLNGKNGLVQAGGLQPSLEHIKLKRYPFVSIHLPFYNEKKVAERILEACVSMDYSGQTSQANFEIIVCDDSTDETVEIVEKFAKKWNSKLSTQGVNRGPIIKVIHRKTREGFKGGALREALKASDPRTEFVVVFDADFVPYPDTLTLFLKYFQVNGLDLSKKRFHTLKTDDGEWKAGVEDRKQKTESNIAVVGGYQWHVLNKSENLITKGVRAEYAGSYVIERPGRELLGALKQISGSVYMIRADLLKKVGWGTSITEDFELTLRLYAQGYKVIYTPYIQAPAECVSTLKRLIRQRMRWAEGHSNNIKKMFWRLMFGRWVKKTDDRGPASPAGRRKTEVEDGKQKTEKVWVSSPLTFAEKLELLYLSPYYLQAAFFMVGTFCWLMADVVFRARLPFWTSLWGWSLVLTNFLCLPLVNVVGLFLEESEEKDYVGLFSFIGLSYILVPFQAYASVKGFIEKEEGPWFRTPKTGRITDIFTRGKFYRWVTGILPRRRPIVAPAAQGVAKKDLGLNPYLALTTANNRFDGFKIRRKRRRWVSKAALVVLLIFSVTLFMISHNVSIVQATSIIETLYIESTPSNVLSATLSYQLVENSTQACDTSGTSAKPGKKVQWTQFIPGIQNLSSASPCPASATGTGWIYDTPFDTNGKLDEDFTIYYYDNDTANNIGGIRACFYRVEVSDVDGSLTSSYLFPTGNLDSADMWDAGNTNLTAGFTDPCGGGCTFTGAQKYLYVDFYVDSDGSGGVATATMYFGTGQCGANNPAIVIDSFVIPENILLIAIVAPFIPLMVMWMKKRKARRLAINK